PCHNALLWHRATPKQLRVQSCQQKELRWFHRLAFAQAAVRWPKLWRRAESLWVLPLARQFPRMKSSDAIEIVPSGFLLLGGVNWTCWTRSELMPNERGSSARPNCKYR